MRYVKSVLLSFLMTSPLLAVECKVNEEGVKLVKHYESFAPKAYFDGGSGRWAVGYGTQAPEHKIGPNTVWTEKKADEVMRKELANTVKILCDHITAPVTSNQLAALTSFAYNLGPYLTIKSTLFAKLNALEIKEASKQFMRYTRSEGVEMRGLKFRRKLEQTLFLTPDFVHIDIEKTAKDIYDGKH